MHNSRCILEIAALAAQFIGYQHAATEIMLEAECCASELLLINIAVEACNCSFAVALFETTGQVIGGRCILNRSEEHTSELQSLMRNSYAVFCLKNKQTTSTIC